MPNQLTRQHSGAPLPLLPRGLVLHAGGQLPIPPDNLHVLDLHDHFGGGCDFEHRLSLPNPLPQKYFCHPLPLIPHVG